MNVSKGMDAKAVVPFETVDLLRSLAQKLHQRGETGDAQTLASAIADIVHTTGAPTFYGDTKVGGCPWCGDGEEVMRIGNKNYAVCHEHRVFWYIGASPLAPGAGDETARRNQKMLASYREVPAADAFSQDACPCCGLFVEHAAWCPAGPKRP